MTMPNVTAQGKTFVCDRGANLREVLVEQGIDLYNDEAKLINCWGMEICGTCTVYVEGEVSPKGWRESIRLALPPHTKSSLKA
jgi:ferredoxin